MPSPAGPAHTLPEAGIQQQHSHSAGDLLRMPSFDKKSVLAVDHRLPDRSPVRGDYRQTGGERLDNDPGMAFGCTRRKDENIGPAQKTQFGFLVRRRMENDRKPVLCHDLSTSRFSGGIAPGPDHIDGEIQIADFNQRVDEIHDAFGGLEISEIEQLHFRAVSGPRRKNVIRAVGHHEYPVPGVKIMKHGTQILTEDNDAPGGAKHPCDIGADPGRAPEQPVAEIAAAQLHDHSAAG